MPDIPVTFIFKGEKVSGHFSSSFGEGDNVFNLYVNNYYWGRLRLPSYGWVFDPTPKREELVKLTDYFSDVIVNWYQ